MQFHFCVFGVLTFALDRGLIFFTLHEFSLTLRACRARFEIDALAKAPCVFLMLTLHFVNKLIVILPKSSLCPSRKHKGALQKCCKVCKTGFEFLVVFCCSFDFIVIYIIILQILDGAVYFPALFVFLFFFPPLIDGF